MKVLIDTNVFLSYLLASVRSRTVMTVVQTCLTHEAIQVLVPREQIDELGSTAHTKAYLRERVANAALQDLLQQFTLYAQLPPPLEAIAAYSRDDQDDYLIAYGVVNDADYLITGDKDLLVLARVGELQIVTPVGFYRILQQENLLA